MFCSPSPSTILDIHISIIDANNHKINNRVKFFKWSNKAVSMHSKITLRWKKSVLIAIISMVYDVFLFFFFVVVDSLNCSWTARLYYINEKNNRLGIYFFSLIVESKWNLTWGFLICKVCQKSDSNVFCILQFSPLLYKTIETKILADDKKV